MTKKISIAIDAMGGDNAPDKTIQGIKIFLNNNKNKNDYLLNVFGREKEIKNKLKKFDISHDYINIINSETVEIDCGACIFISSPSKSALYGGVTLTFRRNVLPSITRTR